MTKRYDVFLSFKNLGADGRPTRDSALAEDIYQYLVARKLSVFLSSVELEAQGVSAFKKAIDAALDASRVLIAVGSSVEILSPNGCDTSGMDSSTTSSPVSSRMVECFHTSMAWSSNCSHER